MAASGLETIKSLRFQKLDPRRLTPLQKRSINHLMGVSLHHDFPDRSPDDVKRALDILERKRSMLDKTQLGGEPGVLQRYAKPVSVLALNAAGEAVAYLPAANNSSNKKLSPFARGIIEAKLRIGVDKLVASRIHWFGMAAISPELMPRQSFEDPDAINLVDAMAAITLRGKKDRQPVAAYPWEGEDRWKSILRGWDMSSDGSAAKPVAGFGVIPMPVLQERWVGQSVARTREVIMNKAGAEQALAHTGL